MTKTITIRNKFKFILTSIETIKKINENKSNNNIEKKKITITVIKNLHKQYPK